MRALLASTLLVLVLATTGCGGGSDAPPPQVKEVTAKRDTTASGKLTSTVVVTFDRELSLARSNVPLASHIELHVPDLVTGETKRVLVATADVPQGQPATLVLTVESLVPDGTLVRIDRKAFDSHASGEIVATVMSDLSPAISVLATSTFQPTLPGILDRAQAIEPTEADRDPAAMRAALEKHLRQRGTNDATTGRALARFDGISMDVVPSPKLRAALAALTGTFAEPAIDYLLGDQNCTRRPAALITFQPPPEAPSLLARATRSADGARVISLNPVTEGDRIEHLMPLLAHEAIHCDNSDGRFEEVAATAFDTFLYMQLISVDDSLVTSTTPLGRDLNIDVVAMINSGRAVPESVGVLKSPTVTHALPGSTSTVASFGDLVVAAYPGLEQNESVDEPLAQSYVQVLSRMAGITAHSAFDPIYLDELLGKAMQPGVLTASLIALGMQPVK
jgi:hypothetical protein